jgi:hypothetical protein
MVKLSETDVREMLERRAAEFDMPAVPTDALLRKARRRKVRSMVLAGSTTVVIVALVGLSMAIPRDSESPSAKGGRLRLVDYQVRAPAPSTDHAHPETGPRVTVEDVRRHSRCMRSQGFDVPAPTEQPGGGWAVIVENPGARGLSFRSRKFREAWFVTCGPLGGPLSGDLVIGGPRPKVDRFMSCMSRHGFDLPEPKKDTSRRYDIDEWQFDLTRTSIDTSTGAWNRAMFVVCGPR